MKLVKGLNPWLVTHDSSSKSKNSEANHNSSVSHSAMNNESTQWCHCDLKTI